MPGDGKVQASGSWRVLIICPNRPLLGQWRSLLEEAELREAAVWEQYPSRDALTPQIDDLEANLWLLDVGTDPARALPLLGYLADRGMTVVALHTTHDPDLVLQCLRRGASEFLFPPLNLHLLVPALERLARRTGIGFQAGTLYCCMPGKASSGNTTLACSLATELKRTTGAKVLLADLDPLFGSMAFLLKLRSDFGLAEAMRDWDRMDEDVWNELLAEYHGVHVLLAPEKPARLELDTAALLHLRQFWRRLYGSVLFDCPGAYESIALDFVRASDMTLLVTTNEMTALYSTRRTFDYLQANGIEADKIRLVVNRYAPRGGVDAASVERVMGCPVFHVLPNDSAAVQSALLDAKEIMEPGSKLAFAVTELAEKLSGAPAPCPPDRPGLFGFLRRQ